ncbi:MAG: hypothetical protein ACTSV2_05710 [Candidatus Thorarchaeota archaeon]
MALIIPELWAFSLLILIPIIITITLLTSLYMRKNPSSKATRFLSVFVQPLDAKSGQSIDNEVQQPDPKRKLISRLAIVYLLLFLFYLSNTIGVFYYVMSDVVQTMTQGSTGLSRIVSSILIESPFTGGWVGSLPWYGSIPLPPAGVNLFHDPWAWIFFTAARTDNLDFFLGTSTDMIVNSFFFASFFLVPLLYKPIRKSFMSSLFLFTSGMAIATRTIFGFFSQAWSLLFNSEIIQFGLYQVSAGQLQVITEWEIIIITLPILILMCAFFSLVGWKLWRGHYPDHNRSHIWFTLYVIGSFWLSLFTLLVL